MTPLRPLQGTRILSLALNLPGPAALLRCARLGAECTKLEPLPQPGQPSADPMGIYSPAAYGELHQGVRVLHAHLKTDEGQAALHAELARTDVLITSFRPSALAKLGLGWEALQARYHRLSLVRIVGALGERAEEPGHDLTYQAEAGLLTGPQVPPTLFADMAGALMASEAVLQALLARGKQGTGVCIDVGLAEAAQWLALPLHWGLTTPQGDVGGAHAAPEQPAQATAQAAPQQPRARRASLPRWPDGAPCAPAACTAVARGPLPPPWISSKTTARPSRGGVVPRKSRM